MKNVLHKIFSFGVFFNGSNPLKKAQAMEAYKEQQQGISIVGTKFYFADIDTVCSYSSAFDEWIFRALTYQVLRAYYHGCTENVSPDLSPLTYTVSVSNISNRDNIHFGIFWWQTWSKNKFDGFNAVWLLIFLFTVHLFHCWHNAAINNENSFPYFLYRNNEELLRLQKIS